MPYVGCFRVDGGGEGRCDVDPMSDLGDGAASLMASGDGVTSMTTSDDGVFPDADDNPDDGVFPDGDGNSEDGEGLSGDTLLPLF